MIINAIILSTVFLVQGQIIQQPSQAKPQTQAEQVFALPDNSQNQDGTTVYNAMDNAAHTRPIPHVRRRPSRATLLTKQLKEQQAALAAAKAESDDLKNKLIVQAEEQQKSSAAKIAALQTQITENQKQFSQLQTQLTTLIGQRTSFSASESINATALILLVILTTYSLFRRQTIPTIPEVTIPKQTDNNPLFTQLLTAINTLSASITPVMALATATTTVPTPKARSDTSFMSTDLHEQQPNRITAIPTMPKTFGSQERPEDDLAFSCRVNLNFCDPQTKIKTLKQRRQAA